MGSISSHMHTKPQGLFFRGSLVSYHRLHDLRGASMVHSKMMLLEYVTHAKSILPEHQDALRRQRASKCEGSCSCSEIIQKWSNQNHIEFTGGETTNLDWFLPHFFNQHYKLWLKMVKVRSTRQREQVPLLFPSSIWSFSQWKPCMSFSQRKPCIVGGFNTLQKKSSPIEKSSRVKSEPSPWKKPLKTTSYTKWAQKPEGAQNSTIKGHNL